MSDFANLKLTRFKGLGYTNYGPGHWQFIDLEGLAQIGPIYPTKAELLADLADFARQRGFDSEPLDFEPKPRAPAHVKTLFLFANGNAAVFDDDNAPPVSMPSPKFSWLLSYVETLKAEGFTVDEQTEILLQGAASPRARLFRTSEGEWNWEFSDDAQKTLREKNS